MRTAKRGFLMGVLDVVAPASLLLIMVILILLVAFLAQRVQLGQPQGYVLNPPSQQTYVLAPPQQGYVLQAPQR